MSTILKRREIPIIIALIFGIPLILDYFFTIEGLNLFVGELEDVASIITTYTLIIGGASILVHYGRDLYVKREKEWWLKLWTMFLIVLVPFLSVAKAQGILNWFLVWVEFPVHVTISAIGLLLYMSGAYRTFRIRSLETTALMLGGIIALLSFAPLFGGLLIPWISPIGLWAREVVYASVSRTLVVSGSMAAIFVAFRVYSGREKAILMEVEGGEG